MTDDEGERLKRQPRSVGREDRPLRSRSPLLLALVLAAAFVAYLPVLKNDFVNFDDAAFIFENQIVRDFSWQGVKGAFAWQLFTPHYKPLVYLTWMTEYRLFGPEPAAFHVNNLLLHLANCTLVFFLVARLASLTGLAEARRVWLAVFTSLWFGVHPLHVESVAWAAERKDVLFAFFFLAAFASYVAYAGAGFHGRGRLAASGGFFLLAVLSKAMALTFVVLPFLLDRLLDLRPRWPQWDKVFFLLVFATALCLYGILDGAGLAGAGAATPGEESSLLPFLVPNLKLWAFAAHLLVPIRLSVVYPGEYLLEQFSGLLWPASLLTVFVAFALARRLASRWSWFWSLFFLVTISPALFTSIGGVNFLSDRYTYLAALGLFCLVTGWVLRLPRSRGAGVALVILSAPAAVWGIATFERCKVWRDSETLWSDVIDKFPGRIHVAYVNRGNAYLEQHRYERALDDYARALDINPGSAFARKNRGVVFARLGRLDDALLELDHALALDPYFADAYLHRAMAKTLLSRFSAAEEDYAAYMDLIPVHAKAHYWRGLNWQAQGKHGLADEQFARALALEPKNRDFLEARAESLAALAVD